MWKIPGPQIERNTLVILLDVWPSSSGPQNEDLVLDPSLDVSGDQVKTWASSSPFMAMETTMNYTLIPRREIMDETLASSTV